MSGLFFIYSGGLLLFPVRAEVQDEGIAFDDRRLRGGAGRDGFAAVVVLGRGPGAGRLVLPVRQGGQGSKEVSQFVT